MEATEVTVAAVRSVGPDAIALSLETPAGFSARPGQFLKVHATVGEAEEGRFYTISSADVEETFELTIEIDPDGDVSPALRDLDPGETVTLSGPYGTAAYDGEEDVLIVAGGPGVGPAIGIAERALDEGGSAGIVYQDDAPIHRDRLVALEDRGAVVHVLEPGEDMQSAVADVLGSQTQVFVYGFADFLDEATAAIAAAGGDPGAAKIENFG